MRLELSWIAKACIPESEYTVPLPTVRVVNYKSSCYAIDFDLEHLYHEEFLFPKSFYSNKVCVERRETKSITAAFYLGSYCGCFDVLMVLNII